MIFAVVVVFIVLVGFVFALVDDVDVGDDVVVVAAVVFEVVDVVVVVVVVIIQK